MTVRLTPAKRRDQRPIAAILRCCHDEADWLPRSSPAAGHHDGARLLLARTEVTVVRSRRHVLGFIARSGASIQSLYLAPQARGQGLGRRLLDHAKAGADRLDLWTHQANREARAFYARQGFFENRLTNGEGNDEKLPDVHLIWAKGMA